MFKADLPTLTPFQYGDANVLRTACWKAIEYARMYPNSAGPIQAFFAGIVTLINEAVPANTAAPAITGTAQVGQTLTASTGTWTGGALTYAYQWLSGGVAVAGATASTYIPVAGDVGKTITVTVTAANGVGSASSTSAATAAVIA